MKQQQQQVSHCEVVPALSTTREASDTLIKTRLQRWHSLILFSWKKKKKGKRFFFFFFCIHARLEAPSTFGHTSGVGLLWTGGRGSRTGAAMGPWAGAEPEAASEAVVGGRGGAWVEADAMFVRLGLPEVEGPLHCSDRFSTRSFFLISFTSALSCLLSALRRCRSAFRTVRSPRLGNLQPRKVYTVTDGNAHHWRHHWLPRAIESQRDVEIETETAE